ncbi:hypothetical protein IT570_00830 [Candidatus Sumerlaeota bacterium]|nr:hypothetical protein [Candidatus Sumerlaeota bacterium]
MDQAFLLKGEELRAFPPLPAVAGFAMDAAMTPPQVTYYIVIPPQRPDTGDSLRPLSRLLKLDEETVRRKLLTTTFEVLQRYAKKANAEGLQGQLRAFGITSLLVSDQDVRSHLMLSAAAANRGAGGIAFRDFNDKPLYCPFEDIGGIALLPVQCEDGKSALLIDIHRRSTNITPRLDAALFSFETLIAKPGATVEDFLVELEAHAKVSVDRRFQDSCAHLEEVARDFASVPGEFTPPPGMILSPYAKRDIRTANIYSFLLATYIRNTL